MYNTSPQNVLLLIALRRSTGISDTAALFCSDWKSRGMAIYTACYPAVIDSTGRIAGSQMQGDYKGIDCKKNIESPLGEQQPAIIVMDLNRLILLMYNDHSACG
jgi:hypothetical protein